MFLLYKHLSTTERGLELYIHLYVFTYIIILTCVCVILHTHTHFRLYSVQAYYNLEGVLQLVVVADACSLAATLSAYRQKH